MVDSSTIMLQVIPWIKTIVYLAIGLGVCIGLAYFLFIVKRRRVWHVNVWEQKADGTLQMVGKDKLIELKVNKGKQLMYKLKQNRIETLPPPWQCVYRLRGKEYCDYIRVQENFVPLERELDGFANLGRDRESIIANFKKAIQKIRKMNIKDVDKRYIHIPLSQSLRGDLAFKPMDYDINLMRISALELREKVYADKLNFWEKYGTIVALGVIVVLIIVVLYMSYDYSQNVINLAMSKTQETAGMVQELASRMNGGVPPS